MGVPGPGGCLVPKEGLVPGCVWSGGYVWRPPETATAVGGTHPTGMHSCYLHLLFFISLTKKKVSKQNFHKFP